MFWLVLGLGVAIALALLAVAFSALLLLQCNLQATSFKRQLASTQARWDATAAGPLGGGAAAGAAPSMAGGGPSTLVESFTLGWANLLIGALWVPVLEKHVSAIATERLQLILNEVLVKAGSKKPWKFIESVAVEEVTFGLVPPRFQFCLAKYDPARGVLCLSMDMSYVSSGFQAVLTPRLRQIGLLQGFGVRLEVTHLSLSGRLNLGLILTREPPGIKGLEYSFASEPSLDLRAAPVGATSLAASEVPALLVSSLRTHLIKVMNRRIVEPNRKLVDLQKIYRNKHVLKVGGAGGMLRVVVVGARDINTGSTQAAAAGGVSSARGATSERGRPDDSGGAYVGVLGPMPHLPRTASPADGKQRTAQGKDGAASAGKATNASGAGLAEVDAYVEMRVGREVFRTPIVHDNAVSPVWNWQFDVRLAADLSSDVGSTTPAPAAATDPSSAPAPSSTGLTGQGASVGSAAPAATQAPVLRFSVLNAMTLGDPEVISTCEIALSTLALQPNSEPVPLLLPLKPVASRIGQAGSGRQQQQQGMLQVSIAWQKAIPKKNAFAAAANPRAAAGAAAAAAIVTSLASAVAQQSAPSNSATVNAVGMPQPHPSPVRSPMPPYPSTATTLLVPSHQPSSTSQHQPTQDSIQHVATPAHGHGRSQSASSTSAPTSAPGPDPPTALQNGHLWMHTPLPAIPGTASEDEVVRSSIDAGEACWARAPGTSQQEAGLQGHSTLTSASPFAHHQPHMPLLQRLSLFTKRHKGAAGPQHVRPEGSDALAAAARHGSFGASGTGEQLAAADIASGQLRQRHSWALRLRRHKRAVSEAGDSANLADPGASTTGTAAGAPGSTQPAAGGRAYRATVDVVQVHAPAAAAATTNEISTPTRSGIEEADGAACGEGKPYASPPSIDIYAHAGRNGAAIAPGARIATVRVLDVASTGGLGSPLPESPDEVAPHDQGCSQAAASPQVCNDAAPPSGIECIKAHCAHAANQEHLAGAAAPTTNPGVVQPVREGSPGLGTSRSLVAESLHLSRQQSSSTTATAASNMPWPSLLGLASPSLGGAGTNTLSTLAASSPPGALTPFSSEPVPAGPAPEGLSLTHAHRAQAASFPGGPAVAGPLGLGTEQGLTPSGEEGPPIALRGSLVPRHSHSQSSNNSPLSLHAPSQKAASGVTCTTGSTTITARSSGRVTGSTPAATNRGAEPAPANATAGAGAGGHARHVSRPSVTSILTSYVVATPVALSSRLARSLGGFMGLSTGGGAPHAAAAGTLGAPAVLLADGAPDAQVVGGSAHGPLTARVEHSDVTGESSGLAALLASARSRGAVSTGGPPIVPPLDLAAVVQQRQQGDAGQFGDSTRIPSAGSSGGTFNSLQSLAQVVRIQSLLERERASNASLQRQIRELRGRVDAMGRLRRAENRRALVEGARFLLYCQAQPVACVLCWCAADASLALAADVPKDAPALAAALSALGASLAEEGCWLLCVDSIVRVEAGAALFPTLEGWGGIRALLLGRGARGLREGLDAAKCFSVVIASAPAAAAAAASTGSAQTVSVVAVGQGAGAGAASAAAASGGVALNLQLPPQGNGRSRDEWVSAIRDLMPGNHHHHHHHHQSNH